MYKKMHLQKKVRVFKKYNGRENIYEIIKEKQGQKIDYFFFAV